MKFQTIQISLKLRDTDVIIYLEKKTERTSFKSDSSGRAFRSTFSRKIVRRKRMSQRANAIAAYRQMPRSKPRKFTVFLERLVYSLFFTNNAFLTERYVNEIRDFEMNTESEGGR